MSTGTGTGTGSEGYRRKLIEVALPLEEINKQSAREKSIRHGHPSTLHLWWARRPLAACRAVLFAQLVDDPSSRPEEFPTEEDQALERKRLFNIIERLVNWDNINDKALYAEAKAEILKSCDGNPPPILDPFAGGGSIPLEAQRLGLEAHASDLNPVPVLINKALIEIPPKWAGQPPVFPGAARAKLGEWPSTAGLVEDVRHYGQWMRDKAEKSIGHQYPKAKLEDGTEVNVVAWIWARTVRCPNPACHLEAPLVNSFTLSRKRSAAVHVLPIIERDGISFTIERTTTPSTSATVSRSGAVCLSCRGVIPLPYVRAEGKAGRLGKVLISVVAEGKRSRIYLPPSRAHEEAAIISAPLEPIDADLPVAALGFRVQGYGLTNQADLYTARQMLLLTTLADLVREAVQKCIADGASSEYAQDLGKYLALLVGRVANRNSSQSFWNPTGDKIEQVFARNALPMIWVYAEANPFSNSTGNVLGQLGYLAEALERLPANGSSLVQQRDATEIKSDHRLVIATDPPYYDNVPYADLSDFFYIWHRRALKGFMPGLYGTVATPKSQELIAEPARAGSWAEAAQFFEQGLRKFFEASVKVQDPRAPLTLFYAFKQSETDETGTASTGWETMLQALVDAGFMVISTWPIRTEKEGGLRDIGRNALASSIVLACRPRQEKSISIDRRGFIVALRKELPDALRRMRQGSVAPVDLAQASIGPGIAIFSRYDCVTESDGSKMSVRSSLILINQILAEVLSEQEGDFDSDTRFCIKWFETYGFDIGTYGSAETLSKAMNTSVDGLGRSGVLSSHANKVQLLSPKELPDGYDPQADDRISVWEVVMHLAKRLDDKGIEAAGQLMAAAKLRVDLDTAKELSYLLFSICERRNWTKTALLFNALGSSWREIESASRSAVPATSAQGMLDLTPEED
ncbi:DUF1156 domain-containing protein [Streptosporangium sp. CA-115845]|uniref:DUF1156 domain-containing protein n=1 Tax=Streptosporangium sp. CA-115845 TaxID=3240071 RepID=UPI003D8DF8FE